MDIDITFYNISFDIIEVSWWR